MNTIQFGPNFIENAYIWKHSNLCSGNGTPLQYSCLANPIGGGAWWAAVHGVATSWTRPSNFTFTFHFHALEKEMATHSSILAWRIPWMKEAGRLQSMGSRRVGHDWATSLSLFTLMHWRRKWQPTPVFLPGEYQGPGSLVGCRLWGCTESDTTEATQQQQQQLKKNKKCYKTPDFVTMISVYTQMWNE